MTGRGQDCAGAQKSQCRNLWALLSYGEEIAVILLVSKIDIVYFFFQNNVPTTVQIFETLNLKYHNVLPTSY
jgi:hypothetical protein